MDPTLHNEEAGFIRWIWAVVAGGGASIVERAQRCEGGRFWSDRTRMIAWGMVVRRVTDAAKSFAPADIAALVSLLETLADESFDRGGRLTFHGMAQALEMRWRRRTGANTPRELLRFGASALRGVAIIEAEYAICRGLAAMDHDVERAADELLALCRIAPDSVMRVCGPDEALRDALAQHPAQWARCEASWKDFVVHCTADFSAASASPIGLDVKSIA